MAELVPDEESRMRRRRRRGASWIRRSARSFWHAAPCCPKKTRARRRHARQMGSDRAIGATPTARFSPGGLLERQGLAFEREFAHGKREPGRRVGLSQPVGLWRKVEAQKHPRAIGGPVQLHQSARLVDPDRQTLRGLRVAGDRKSTRLNSSHMSISYAVFC